MGAPRIEECRILIGPQKVRFAWAENTVQCGRSCTGAAVAFSCGVEETLCVSFAVRGNTGVGDLGVMFKRRVLGLNEN